MWLPPLVPVSGWSLSVFSAFRLSRRLGFFVWHWLRPSLFSARAVCPWLASFVLATLVASFVLGPRPSSRARGLRSRPALSGLSLLSLFPTPWDFSLLGAYSLLCFFFPLLNWSRCFSHDAWSRSSFACDALRSSSLLFSYERTFSFSLALSLFCC